MENRASNSDNSSEKPGKFVRMGKNLGHMISVTPLFRALKEKASLYFHNPEQLQDEITSFYNEATNEHGRKTVADMWQKIKNMYAMVQDALQNNYTALSKPKLIIGIAVLLYVVIPTDVIPDVLPVLGFADDMALLAWFLKHAAREIHNYEIWRSTRISPIETYAG